MPKPSRSTIAEALEEELVQLRRRRRRERHAHAVLLLGGHGGGLRRGSRPSRRAGRSRSRRRATTRSQKRDAEKRSPTTNSAPWLSAWMQALSAFVWKSGRQVIEHVVAREAAEHRRGAARPPVELRLRAHDALRGPGGAGRVEDRDRVARAARRRSRSRSAWLGKRPRAEARGSRRRERWSSTQSRSSSGGSGVEHLEVLEEARLDDQHARRGVRQDVLQLRSARRRVERDEDRAEPGACEPGVDDLEPVLRHDRDAIAVAHAARRRSRRQGARSSRASR